jgi:hypothetical protein
MEALIRQKLKEEGFFKNYERKPIQTTTVIKFSKESIKTMPDHQRAIFERFMTNYEARIKAKLRQTDEVHWTIDTPITREYIQSQRNAIEFHRSKIHSISSGITPDTYSFYTGKRSDLHAMIARHSAESFDSAMMVINLMGHIQSEYKIISDLNNSFTYE